MLSYLRELKNKNVLLLGALTSNVSEKKLKINYAHMHNNTIHINVTYYM